MSALRKHILLHVLEVLTLFIMGCGAGTFDSTAANKSGLSQQAVLPEALLISGAKALTLVDATAQLHATEVSSDTSSKDATGTVTWSASAAQFVSVNSAGLATCHASGSSIVSATLGQISANVVIGCTAPQVVTPQALLISGRNSMDLVGATTQLQATEVYSDQSTLDVTNSVAWNTSSPASILVNKAGLTTCQSTGSSTVSATSSQVSGSIAISCVDHLSAFTVSPVIVAARVGDQIAVSATATDNSGNTLDVSSYSSWTPASSLVQINSQFMLNCIQPGQTSVSVLYDNMSQTIQVSCSSPSMTSPSYFMEQSDDFVGPFPSWSNVKTKFGAVGDGRTDDTAALQKAIDTLIADANSPVIWLPAGTYCISSPLTITHKRSFSIIGEDPQTTVLSWCGPPGGTMLQTDASTYFRISRLTFDGQGVADTAENLADLTNSAGGYYSTFNELSDQHIKGVRVGIRLPSDAETSIERVHFDGLTLYGLQSQSFNTLNIFINDSLFTHCGVGLTNEGGAGNFIVSNSYFVESTVADMQIGNTGYFTARHNTSLASAAFFLADPVGGNPAQITLQNNTILDPKGIPVMLGNEGPLMLIDNVVRMQNQSLPVVQGFYDSAVTKTVFSFGNTFTVPFEPRTESSATFQGVYRSYDDSVISPSAIPDVIAPSSVYTPPNLHRTIFEVPVDSSGAFLQTQIDLAAAQVGSRVAVHIPFGTYHVTKGLVIPVGSDLELLGDDPDATNLVWDGSSSDFMINMEASNSSLKYLHLSMGSGALADGITVPIADQPTTHVLVNEAELQAGNTTSVLVDGVEHANVELFSTYTLGSSTGVSVTGGPYRAAKRGALGITNFYTGSMQSEGSATSFDVSAGGRFMVQDNWHDAGGTSPQNFKLSGSGTVTEQIGMVAMSGKQPFEVDDFDGKVTLIGLTFQGGFIMKPGQGSTNLLTLGLLGDNTGYLPQSSGNLIANNLLDDYWANGGNHIPTVDAPDTDWLRGMLAQTRSEYPSPRLAMNALGTRTRIQRVQLNGFRSAIHVFPAQVPRGLYYTLTMDGQALSNGSSGDGKCLGETPYPTGNAAGWNLQDAGDGDYTLYDLATTKVLGISGTNSGSVALGMSNPDGLYDQRWVVQDIGDGRRSLRNRATGDLLTWTPGACAQLSKSVSEASSWIFRAY